MAAPTPIEHKEVSSWTTTTTPKTATIVNGQAGDRITVLGGTSDTATLTTPTNDGAALTWTPTTAFGTPGSSTQVRGWSTTLDTTRTVVITMGRSATTNQWGFFADVWRASDGIGASGGVNVDTSVSYSCSVTTTQANSALVGIATDWSAINGARTWTAISNAFVSEEAVFSSGQYYVAGGYYPDVGAIGAKTPAISAPSGETVTMVFIEVLGSTGGTPISVTLTPATETDTAQALVFIKPIVVTLTPATESDGAQALSITHPIIVTLTPASETDTAIGAAIAKLVTLVPATETDSPVVSSTAKAATLTPATETDTAQGITFTKTIFKTLIPADETDTAQALSITQAGAQHITLVPATETDTAVPLVFSVFGGGLANRKRYYIQRMGHSVRRRAG